MNGFSSAFEGEGGVVALKRSFPQGTTDFRTVVTEMARVANFDRLLVIAYPDEYRAFFQELADHRCAQIGY